jgi:hypothetical protein
LPILSVQDCPRVTIIANGAWYFRGARVKEFRTTCTTLTAIFRSKLAAACLASGVEAHHVHRESLE